jgi:hypothetical protein
MVLARCRFKRFANHRFHQGILNGAWRTRTRGIHQAIHPPLCEAITPLRDRLRRDRQASRCDFAIQTAAQSGTIRARNASACAVLPQRLRACSVPRSAGFNTMAAVGLPITSSRSRIVRPIRQEGSIIVQPIFNSAARRLSGLSTALGIAGAAAGYAAFIAGGYRRLLPSTAVLGKSPRPVVHIARLPGGSGRCLSDCLHRNKHL